MKNLICLCCISLLLSCGQQQKDTAQLNHFLALGDSYTIGESVADSLRWPNQLVKRLNQNKKIFTEATIIAKTGWTTDELMQGINTAALKDKYDYVSLLIGVNNQYRGRDIENFKVEFIELLEKSIALAGNDKEKVFVLSIPDWGVMPFARERDQEKIKRQIDAFNQVVKNSCAQYKVAFFDITPISRAAAVEPVLIASDGLHPSGEMYARWVEYIINFIKIEANSERK